MWAWGLLWRRLMGCVAATHAPCVAASGCTCVQLDAHLVQKQTTASGGCGCRESYLGVAEDAPVAAGGGLLPALDLQVLLELDLGCSRRK